MNRRTALKTFGAIAGAAAFPRLLGGCGGNGGNGSDGGIDRTSLGITNVVLLCMENRSYNHFLGARSLLESKPGDGLTMGMSNPNKAGTAMPIFHTDVACVADPPHGWNPSRAQWNNGTNDGFMVAYQNSQGDSVRPHVMGYLTRADIPATWALADEYASCDRWFSSLMGPTWPNRLYLLAAQSEGRKSNDVPTGGKFTFPTIFHRLAEKKVEWKSYYTDLPFLSLFGMVPGGRITRIDDFFTDAANGELPPFSFIEPGFAENDDHPPHHPILGQKLISELYEALATSPQWVNTLFIITYDEHGGFFDHVSPPKAADERAADGFDQLGFRVPTIVVGPYVKKGHVSSVVREHTSVLRHVEKMFDLPPLTQRDAAANDLSELINQDRLTARQPNPPANLAAVTVDPNIIIDACKNDGLKSELVELADAGGIPAELDRRAQRAGRLQSYVRNAASNGGR